MVEPWSLFRIPQVTYYIQVEEQDGVAHDPDLARASIDTSVLLDLWLFLQEKDAPSDRRHKCCQIHIVVKRAKECKDCVL